MAEPKGFNFNISTREVGIGDIPTQEAVFPSIPKAVFLHKSAIEAGIPPTL